MLFNAERKHWKEAKHLFSTALHLILFSNLFPLNIPKCLFLIPYIVFIYLYEINLKYVLISLLLSIPLIALQSVPALHIKTTYFSYLNHIFNANNFISKLLDYLHEKKISNLIKGLIFNVKIYSPTINFFYKSGIAHLITVSGFHLSNLSFYLSKIIKSKKILIISLLIYWAFLDYSIAALRAILAIILSGKNKYKSWSISALIAPIFNVSIYKNISFFLSWFLPLIFLLNKNLCKNKSSLYLLNLTSAFIYSSLVLLPFKKNINILSPIYLTLLSPIVIFSFIYFFITWPLSFLSPIHTLVSEILNHSCKTLDIESANFNIKSWSNPLTLIGLSIFSLIFAIGQYKCLNFTTQKIKGS